MVYKQDKLFDAMEFQQIYCKYPFVLGDTYLTLFTTYAVAFCTTHVENNKRKYDTDSFVPFASLNDVVGFPSFFIRSLIVSTVKNMICRIH